MSKANSDTIAERRLRPIYDWLDNGNNKKAIQEADKVLKKQPQLLCAQVLKGLALLRLGKNKDCEDILETVHKKMPADDCTLQAMTICYREIHQLEKICDVYEKAVSKDPWNEELNTHLFMAYVRVGDYKKQQQVAMNLYKIKQKNPYYFWGVMSIIMQAQKSDDKISQKVMLPLAERMINKFIIDGKIEAEQEIQLYIMVLEMQKKYQEALDFIDNDFGYKLVSYHIPPRKRIKLLQLLEQWLELNVYIKRIILEQPDAYQNYVIYFDSVFKLMTCLESGKDSRAKENNEPSERWKRFNSFNGELLKPDDSVELCVRFVRDCKAIEVESNKLRGPHLAMLLLYKKLIDQGYDAAKYIGIVFNLFEDYFQLFADRPCCFKDLHQFLHLIQEDHERLLSSSWRSIQTISDNGIIKTKKELMMCLTYFELGRFFNVFKDEKLSHISKLLHFYHDGHQFNVNLTPTDLGCSDVFIIVATHYLHDLYLEINDLKYIKDAICLLEYAYQLSPSNHHFKLLLLKFYNMLGASKVSYKYYQLLEIKHMQYDSLGYLECWPLLHLGQYAFAVHLLENTLKFFTVNYRETADQLTSAYKYGSFEQVNSFLNFREKLRTSHHYCLVCIEHTIHELIHSANHNSTIQAAMFAQPKIANLEELSADNFNCLVDNRDVYLFLSFDSDTRRMNEKYTKLSFEHEIILVRIRMLILQCVELSINICSTNFSSLNSVNNADKEPSPPNGINGDIFDSKYLLKFESTIGELRRIYELILCDPIQEIPKDVFSGVESWRLFLYSKSFFLPLFINTMQFVHDFCSHYFMECRTEEQLQQIADSCCSSFSKVIIESNQILKKSSDATNYRELFEHVSLVVEMICIMSVVCGNLHSLLVVSNKKKKKKKGKSVTSSSEKAEVNKNKQVIDNKVHQIFTTYLNSAKKNIELFSTNLCGSISVWGSFEPQEPEFELGRWQAPDRDLEFNSNLGISKEKWFDLQSNVNKDVGESYKSSVNEFSNVVSHKLEYLSLFLL